MLTDWWTKFFSSFAAGQLSYRDNVRWWQILLMKRTSSLEAFTMQMTPVYYLKSKDEFWRQLIATDATVNTLKYLVASSDRSNIQSTWSSCWTVVRRSCSVISGKRTLRRRQRGGRRRIGSARRWVGPNGHCVNTCRWVVPAGHCAAQRKVVMDVSLARWRYKSFIVNGTDMFSMEQISQFGLRYRRPIYAFWLYYML